MLREETLKQEIMNNFEELAIRFEQRGTTYLASACRTYAYWVLSGEWDAGQALTPLFNMQAVAEQFFP
jgi:hypothetical protein